MELFGYSVLYAELIGDTPHHSVPLGIKIREETLPSQDSTSIESSGFCLKSVNTYMYTWQPARTWPTSGLTLVRACECTTSHRYKYIHLFMFVNTSMFAEPKTTKIIIFCEHIKREWTTQISRWSTRAITRLHRSLQQQVCLRWLSHWYNSLLTYAICNASDMAFIQLKRVAILLCVSMALSVPAAEVAVRRYPSA